MSKGESITQASGVGPFKVVWVNPADELDQLEEGIQVVRALLTQDRSTFDGEHFHLHEARCLPKPVQ
jgi:alkanesulfonate monooxygenase SsuD/methylene tetrahydromethanopterin reductase-like flavin-dependent oxidoreductase (luciferase family)